MKKRSEVMAAKKRSEAEEDSKKKSSASDRTIPLFEETKLFKNEIRCDACEETSELDDLIRSEKGTYECNHCGARIDVSKPESKKKESPPSPQPVEKKLESDPRGKIAKLPNTSDTGVYCEECGTQWPRVHEEIWKICGHKGNAVDDPSLAKQIKHLAGQPMPVVKKVRVVIGEAMFRIADFSIFRTPVVELEAEVKPNEDYREVQKRLYLEAKRQADEAFHDIHESYMQKLGFIRDDLATRK